MLRNDVGPPIVHYVPVIRPVPTGANVLGQFPLFDYDPPPTLPVYQQFIKHILINLKERNIQVFEQVEVIEKERVIRNLIVKVQEE